MRTKRIVAAAAAALALAACDPKEKDAAPEVSTPSAFCSAIMASYGAKFAACFHATPAYVAAFTAAAGGCPEVDAYVALGRVHYSPADAATCLGAFEAAPCDGVDDAELLTPACARMATGTVAPGGACAIDTECAGGTCDTTGTCSGTCVAYLAAGADCRMAQVDCAAGLLCDDQGSGTCVAPAPGAAGQACGPGELACDPGLYCDAGVCRAKLAAGASCLAAIAGDADRCAVGTSCHEDSFLYPTRAECVPWVGAGAACGEWIGSCGPGLSCVGGACAPEPIVGQPCGATEPCLLGSWCDAGTCAAAKPLGASCSDYDQCGASNYCDGVTCVGDPVCMP